MTFLTRLAQTAALAAAVAHVHAAPVAGQGTWESTLLARDINGNAVALNSTSAAFFYDTTLNVTWLANMNQNGQMNWSSAMAWADGLTTGGYTDWRLPTMIDSGTVGCNFSNDGGTDCGFNVQTKVGAAYSEWAHLFFVTLGNLSSCLPGGNTPTTCEARASGFGLTNSAYFQGMQNTAYWTGTAYVSATSGEAWYFGNTFGRQNSNPVTNALFAVAVRNGDVLSTVPEPRSLALALTALASLGLCRRRRHAG